MIVLDTDIISLLDRGGGHAFDRLAHRLRTVPDQERVCTTIVSFEEHLRGWLSQIATARTSEAEVIAYGRLQRILSEYALRDVLPYDGTSAETCRRLRRNQIRIGTMDMRIGSIVLTNDALL